MSPNPHGKRSDSPVLRYLNRPVSAPVTRLLLRTRLTPDTITVLSFLIVLAGAGLIAPGTWWGGALGGLLVQAGFTLDCADGEVARARGQTSARGALLDTILDRYADLALLAALTLAAAGSAAAWAWAFAAASASLLVPYLNALCPTAPGRLMRRAERLLLCAVAAVAGVPLWALIAVAIVGNIDAARVCFLVIRDAPGPVTGTGPRPDR